MDDDWSRTDCEHCVEMPEPVVAMRATDDGQLLVTLAGGRVVDMAAWFSAATPAPAQPASPHTPPTPLRSE